MLNPVLICVLYPLVLSIVLALGAALHAPERLQSEALRWGLTLNGIVVALTVLLFFIHGTAPIHAGPWVLFEKGDYAFKISLTLDVIALPFLAMTAFFGCVVAFFSRRYMHREPGARRFFFVISAFVFGMQLTSLSGELDILFAGWEIVGVSSYLLIAYFWEREKPVRSAERVYWVYRLCDVGLLLGALLSHQTEPGWVFGALLVLAAVGKSAQFPFMTWLPRALEGPTPSSAIFYGALSIHLGVFLLARTESTWNGIPGFPVLIGVIGFISAGLASAFGRQQSTIKGQIAYASSAQVGVMFLELALGFRTLALLHFCANALLRGYQFLSAPSIVSEQLRTQSAMGGVVYRTRWLPELFLPERARDSLFVFSLNEGYLDLPFQYAQSWMSRLLDRPKSTLTIVYFLQLVPFVIAAPPQAAYALTVAYIVAYFAIDRSRALFFAAILGLLGFPVGFGFIAEDLVFHHLVPSAPMLCGVVCVSYVFSGVCLVQLFGRQFLGERRLNRELTPVTTLFALALFCLAQTAPFLSKHFAL